MLKSPQYSKEGRPRTVGKMFKRKLTKNYANLKILVPYLSNPSEEAIFENNKTEEAHETMTLQNEEVMLKKHINP